MYKRIVIVLCLVFASCTSIVPNNISQEATVTRLSDPSKTFREFTSVSEGTVNPSVTAQVKSLENCDLPCWWGITPGETSWKEANEILEKFPVVSIEMREISSDLYSEEMIVHFASDIGKDYDVSFGLQDGIVQVLIFYTRLDEILTRNGIPAQIWIHAYANAHGGITQYVILLYFPTQGNFVYLENEAHNVSWNRELVEICPYDENFGVPFGTDWFFPTKDNEYFWVGLINTYNMNFDNFARLEDISEWDAQMFYDSFKNPESEDCFIVEGHD
ncbi:MAG: hypothetical protein JXB38_00220 [Anaerolineales bacterium]|nr:hypothetical protein [Anaerolineales bacterium]